MAQTSAVKDSKVNSRKTMAKQQGTKSTAGKSAASGKRGGDGMDRRQMVAVAAYFRAEHRGFDGGDPVTDWLDAEAEIDALLKNKNEISMH